MTFEYILSNRKKLPTNIYGLKWKPSLEPDISDDADWVGHPWQEIPRHFTELDHKVLSDAFQSTVNPKLILEIGVNRSEAYEVSSTSTLIKIKPKTCGYLGVDIEDKSFIDDPENKVYTVKSNSAYKDRIFEIIDILCGKGSKIDFMFVDGWHSVNQVLKEWEYWDRMSEKGIMGFHDINCHPGPVAVLDAVDPELFSVDYYGRGEHDWGIGVIKRR